MRIKIGWKLYEVITKEEVYNSEGKQCYGTIDTVGDKIHLWGANSLDRNNVTLLHEALHGISDMYNIDLDEEAVTKLADTLYIFIKDNPEIIQYKLGGGVDE